MAHSLRDLFRRAPHDLYSGIPDKQCELLSRVNSEVRNHAGEAGTRKETVVAVTSDVGVERFASDHSVIGEAESRCGGSKAHENGLWFRGADDEVRLIRCQADTDPSR